MTNRNGNQNILLNQCFHLKFFRFITVKFYHVMDISLEDISEQHKRVIIHIDIDCYYAQVEEIRNPELRTKPVGVQQKNYIVTSNYVAREFGVKKMMLLKDALALCPNLVLVNGEDLINYRQMSNKIFNLMLKFTPFVEKLGLDENFLDVTDVVNNRLSDCLNDFSISGCIYPENESLDSCDCGCEKRLTMGTILAAEIRAALYNELGLTSCGGIAHNKLLAKLIGSKNKPNKQTVLVPTSVIDTMIEMDSIRRITGIGEKAEQSLNEIGIRTVKDLQDVNYSVLENKFGSETAYKYKNWSRGVDNTSVIPSGKPKTISLEDSCVHQAISVRSDVEDKFRLLLIRLVNQVAEDGRIPLAVKIILRKFDPVKKTSHRETKQANILPTLFKEVGDGKVVMVDGGQDKILKIIMRLFERVVDLKSSFNITLIGLAFSKFQERRRPGMGSIANFLIKSDLEVQSITSIKSDGCTNIIPSHSIFEKMRNYLPGSPIHMDVDAMSEASHASYSSDVSESEIEPSPKKTRIGFLLSKRRCLPTDDVYDTASPSKLRVADLRLNSKENEYEPSPLATTPPAAASEPMSTVASEMASTSMIHETLPPQCPSTVDPEVFKALPKEVQEELLQQWSTPVDTSNLPVQVKQRTGSTSKGSKSKTTLHRYFITNK